MRRSRLLLLLLLASTLAVRAANPVLLIQGTGGSGGDVTAFIDLVQVVQVSNGATIGTAVGNAGFESPNLGPNTFAYNPAALNWTFTGQSGIAQNGSGFGSPAAPEGVQVSMLQGLGFAQQTLSLGTGTYVVKFLTAQRNCCSSAFNQGLNVFIDGILVGSITPANNGTWQQFTSSSFTVDAPAATALSPTRNARTAAVATNVGVTFSQNIDNATASNIRVFSAQAGGKKAGAYSTSGGTVTFNPTTDFEPGETVFSTIPTAVASTGGATITNKQVYQFTTAASGTGRGNFLPGPADLSVGNDIRSTAVGDFNGDGSPDLAVANYGSSTVSIRFNNGSGAFTGGGSDVNVGTNPQSIALGDVDADGDLDFVTANASGTMSARFNNGSGTFSVPAFTANPTLGGFTIGAALGDVDADGDLDYLTTNGNGVVYVRLNTGGGLFNASSTVSVGPGTYFIALGDADNDGDLDFLTANYNSGGTGSVSVRLNNGSGTFSGGSEVSVANAALTIVLGDVDGDGDLDFLTANDTSAKVCVRLNNGSGGFSGGADVAAGGLTRGLALGDVDADGDLDFAATNASSRTVSIRLNDGFGNYSGTTNLSGTYSQSMALADLDGDGDLDYVTGNFSDVTVRLNQPFSTITGISPTPGVRGQAVTVTGTNLSGVTAVSVNGVVANTASFLNNTATSLTFRVPATAGTSGTTTLTTPLGTASTTTFTTAAATPPGNALSFDGSNDYVRISGSLPATGEFTLEAWMNPTAFSGSLDALIMADNFPGQAMHCQFYGNNLGFTVNGNSPMDVVSTTALPTGRWSHVAVVYSASARTVRFYVNGVLNHTGTYTTAVAVAATPYSIGSWFSGGPQRFFNGKLDEVRIYTAALTQAQVQADMLSTASAVPASLNLYLSFDQGTAGGNNVGQTTLYDQSANAFTGTLTNFTLSGTASNYLESYALVVPTATAATNVGSTGFTATWTAPAVGTVTNYLLDVSTSSTFASAVSGSPFTVSSGTSRAITGLVANTTYYYRVRADKTSVTGQGAYSGVITATTCAAPAAVAQNVTVTLNASGTATVAATAINNGSTANCGPAAAGSLSVSPGTFSCTDATPTATNTALSFNGINQYVEGTNANLPLGNTARTLEAWLYPTAAGSNGVIFNYGTPTSNQRSGLLISGGNLYYVGENNDLRGNIALTVNAWNHVAATYDGTTLRLYVNGMLDVQSNTSAFNTTGTIWRIAQRSAPQTGEYLTGRIDEVRVWSVARTATQIASSRAVSLPGSTSGLVASYRLNEGSGSTTADASASNSPGMLFNSPTWLSSGAPVTSGVPVTLTVTDASGAISSATAVVTVLDNTAPGTAGSGPLPAAPLLATSNVPEAGNYGVLYQLDIPNAASFNSLSSVPYTVNNSGASIAQPARVAYFMELQSGSVTKWVWASMDNFASTLTQLGMPNPTANNVVWNQNVSNLNVFASSNAGVTTGSNLGTGRLEMWTTDYLPNNASAVPGASGSLYDFGDQRATTRNYGSFQVHNVTAGQTLLAYNNWGSNGDGGGIGDLGIGNQVGGSGQPDWTFAYNASTYTVKRIYILVPNNSAFTQPATVTLNASGTATLTQSQVYTGAADNCAIRSVVVTPTTFTCAQVGTPQTVTVTVSDASGNTTTQSAEVTVTAPATPTTTWDGSASTNWLDCANWSFGKVPDATTNVVIPAGLSRYPSLPAGTYSLQSLTVANGATLATTSTTTLQVSGDWTNNGTATLGGPVVFTGSAATQTLGGATSTSFTTLTVNKTAGVVQLAQNLPISGTLTLSSGTLVTTASYQVALGSTATLSESATSYVTGTVMATRPLTPGATQAFGGLGLRLTPAAGSISPGATVVLRTTGSALSGPGTSRSIQRYYDILPATNAGLNMTVELGYFDAELDGINETDLGIFRSSTGTTGPWEAIASVGASTSANTVTATGIDHFSVWTLGARSNPLPVTLVSFSAEAKGADALLRWRTASELNNAYFEVEASTTGSVFQRVGRLVGQGTTTRPSEYSLTDANLARYGVPVVYYRLRQVDLDGTVTLSEVRPVQVPAPASAALMVYPNPAHTATTVTGAVAGAEVQVLDAVGRLVAAVRADAAGQARLPLPNGLPTGVYLVRSGTQAQRLLVE